MSSRLLARTREDGAGACRRMVDAIRAVLGYRPLYADDPVLPEEERFYRASSYSSRYDLDGNCSTPRHRQSAQF